MSPLDKTHTVLDLAETLARTVVVDAATLATELRSSRPPALLDVRWALGDPDGLGCAWMLVLPWLCTSGLWPR